MSHCPVDLFHLLKVLTRAEFHPVNVLNVMRMKGTADQLKGDLFVLAVAVTVPADLELFQLFSEKKKKKKEKKKFNLKKFYKGQVKCLFIQIT